MNVADALPARAEMALFLDYPDAPPLAFVLTVDGRHYSLDAEKFIFDMVRLYGDPPVAMAAATCLRSLANDLDALAYGWRQEAHAANKRNPYL